MKNFRSFLVGILLSVVISASVAEEATEKSVVLEESPESPKCPEDSSECTELCKKADKGKEDEKDGIFGKCSNAEAGGKKKCKCMMMQGRFLGRQRTWQEERERKAYNPAVQKSCYMCG